MKARITSLDNAKRRQMYLEGTYYESGYQKKKWMKIYEEDKHLFHFHGEPQNIQQERAIIEEELADAFEESRPFKRNGEWLDMKLNGINPQFVEELAAMLPPPKEEKYNKRTGLLVERAGWKDEGSPGSWLFEA